MIDIRNLAVQVGGRRLFEGFCLSVARGEAVTLAGPSGVGKTTLFRTLLGFVAPAEGEIHITGKPITVATVWRLRRCMAHVAQSPELDGATVREALFAPFAYHANRHLSIDEQRAAGLLAALGLPRETLDQETAKLSGGECRRAALAGALLLERPILLLDEPTSGLDPDSRAAMVELLARQKGLTTLTISHDTDGFLPGERLVHLAPAREGGRP